MKPHKHAELIKAWADGAEIQIFNPDNMEWEDLQCTPVWNDQMKYRIKPEPKPDVVVAEHLGIHYFYNDPKPTVMGYRLSKPNVLFVFDGETGELKSVEVLKKASEK
jgi:hypothetical protein